MQDVWDGWWFIQAFQWDRTKTTTHWFRKSLASLLMEARRMDAIKKKSNVGDITKKITSNTVTLFSLWTITQHVIAVMHRGPQGRLRRGTRTLCTAEVTHAANLFSQDQNTFRHQNQIWRSGHLVVLIPNDGILNCDW